MNDQQFQDLLDALNNIAASIDDFSDRVTVMTAAFVKINDPEGWEEAKKEFEDDGDE